MNLSKSDTVRGLVADGEYKKALNIAKGFQLGITKEDSSKMKLAYECLVYPVFYKQIGTDTETAILEGVQILVDLYGKK